MANEIYHAYARDQYPPEAPNISGNFQSDLFSAAVLRDLGYTEYLNKTSPQTLGDGISTKSKQFSVLVERIEYANKISPEDYKAALKLYSKVSIQGQSASGRSQSKGSKSPGPISDFSPLRK